MPLQPRTSRTGSVLPLLGSDSNSNSNSSYLLRPEIGGLQAERICQREPIRQVKFPLSYLQSLLDLPFPGLPPLDLPPLPPLCERSFSQQQPPPSTSTRIRVRQPVTAPYLPRSQQGLSHPTSPTPTMFPTPTTNPYDDWTTRSFTPPDFSPLGPLTRLPSPYSIPIPPMQLLPSFTPHYPPQRFSRTATQVGGALPTILEGPEKLEKALRALSRPAYLMLRCVLVCNRIRNPSNTKLNKCVPPSISAALLNINAFNNNSITKVPLMIATTASFFAVMTHWVATLQLHASQSVRRSLAQSDIA